MLRTLYFQRAGVQYGNHRMDYIAGHFNISCDHITDGVSCYDEDFASPPY